MSPEAGIGRQSAGERAPIGRHDRQWAGITRVRWGVAADLGMMRSTMQWKMKKRGISRPA
jgi:hypothetical protein